MKGLLVYTKEDAVVNRWFIGQLIEISADMGIELSLYLQNDNVNFAFDDAENIDFCINRSRYDVVNKFFECRGIPCFNNGKTVGIANDKYKTYLLCKSLGVPVMDTCLYTPENACVLGFPCVVKSVSGHGGSEVYWSESIEELGALPLDDNKQYILQKPCSDKGVDVRVYVMGGEVICAVKRSSEDNFRSNYSLGGKAELFDATKEQREVISILQKELHTDYAGFDFILHNGNWVLNEVEDAVGSRMIYTLMNIDVAEKYVKYIEHNIKFKQ